MYSKCGDGEVMTEVVDMCLAVCCKMMQAGLSLNSLLNCVLYLVSSPMKVFAITIMIIVDCACFRYFVTGWRIKTVIKLRSPF